MSDVTITTADSPIPNAIDQYYSFLRNLFQPTSNQNIALNSTLVTFDIVKNAPLYNEGVFRAFADRTIGLSPTNFGPGAANIGDRFSERYTNMLGRLLATIDVKLSAELRDAIRSHKTEIGILENQLVAAYAEMSERWNTEKKTSGIRDDDPNYLEKMVAFFNTFAFATKLRNLKSEILDQYEAIRVIRVNSYPDDAARELAEIYRYADADEYKVVRPIDPRLEALRGYDHVKLAQLWVYGNIGGTFDVGQEIRASGYMENFLTRVGNRGFSITKGSQADELHDTRWSTTSTSTHWLFFKVSTTVEHQDKWRKTVSKTNKIAISFENMAEYWVNRGRWFSSTIFDHQIVKDYLKNNPLLARDLSYAITSVVLGRGLTLTLSFDSAEEFERWDTLKVDVSAGFSFLGINIPGGASDFNSYSWTKTVDTVNKTVTFKDDSEHCRLLGFRVEKLFDFNEQDRLREFASFEEIQALGGGLEPSNKDLKPKVFRLRDLDRKGTFVK